MTVAESPPSETATINESVIHSLRSLLVCDITQPNPLLAQQISNHRRQFFKSYRHNGLYFTK